MGQIITRYKQLFVYCLLGVVSIGISLLVGIGLPVVALSLVLIYKIIYLPDSVNRPLVRACLAVVLQLTLFNIFGLLLHLIRVDVSANMYGVYSLLAVGVIFVAQSMTDRLPKAVKFSQFDVIALIPVVLGSAMLLLYIFGHGLSFSENLVRFMGSSSDQSAHLAMFNDILRNDGNHVYATDKMSINTPGINSYPMGWHQSMAVLSLNLLNIQPTEVPFIDVIVVYFACALITFVLYGVAISIFTSLIYDAAYSKRAIAKVFGRKLSAVQGVVVKSFIVLTVIFLFLYVTFCELGYINFIYAAAIVLLGGIFMTGLSKAQDISVGVLSLFALLLFAATEAWYIMALPIGIVLAYLTIVYLKRVGFVSVLQKSSSLLLLAGYLLLGVAFIVILRNIMADGSTEQIQIGNAAAPWLPDTLILLSTVVASILLSNRIKKGLLHVLVNGFFASILLLTALNFLHLQAYSYYQQKMLYAFFAFSIPVAFIALIKLLQDRNIRLPIILSLIPFLLYTMNPGDIVYITKNIMRPKSDPEISIVDQYFQSKFDDRSTVIFIKDYRTNDERFTEPYARLLLSKVVSPGDCYNQLVMPLLSLSGKDKQSQDRSNSAANEAASRCYGNVKFFKLTDSQPVTVEYSE